ncbi:MAG: DUF2268 domain-containing putative Zn-dependent protease [Caulobacteraceae bacterium]
MHWKWTTRLGLAGVIAAISTVAGAAGSISDLTPSFWAFWAAAKDKPAEEQIKLWKQLYYEPNREVLSPLPCGGLTKDESLLKAFGRIPKYEAGMRAMAKATPRELPRARARFNAAFPDMAWDGDIYVLYTAGCFDGKPFKIRGRSALLFGMDVAAQVGETELAPLMQHELFHVYHRTFFPETEDDRLWNYVWEEGLAVYAAKALNPKTSNTNLLIGGDLVPGVEAKRALIAQDILDHFESREEPDYMRYFMGGTKNGEFPSRAAYYMGFLVADQIGRSGVSLREMAHWSAAEAKPHVRAALEALAKP